MDKMYITIMKIASLLIVSLQINSAIAEESYEVAGNLFCIPSGYVNGYAQDHAISISAHDILLLPYDLSSPVLTDVEAFITIQENEDEWSSGFALGVHLGTNVDYSGALESGTIIYVNDLVTNLLEEVEVPNWFDRSNNYIYRADNFDAYLSCFERMSRSPLSQKYGCIIQAETEGAFLEGIVDVNSLHMVEDVLRNFELLMRSFSCEDGEVR